MDLRASSGLLADADCGLCHQSVSKIINCMIVGSRIIIIHMSAAGQDFTGDFKFKCLTALPGCKEQQCGQILFLD